MAASVVRTFLILALMCGFGGGNFRALFESIEREQKQIRGEA